MAADNSTIYVDVDDEITALIDKVRKSDGRVVALVLPKRATVLQSIVNMKLLKRSADSEKKRLVLVTSESGLMPLAGAVGLHVAGSLTSRPEIPPPPLISPADSEPIDEDSPLTLDDSEGDNLKAKGATSMSVGELAAAANQSIPSKKAPDALDTLELDNEEKPLEPKKDAKAAKTKKDKHLKVPNFDRFRWLLVLITVVLIAIIVLGVLALDVWPHASIYIKTNAGTVNTDLTLNLDSTVHQPDYTAGNLPAQIVQEQKTFTQTVNTTGQKNAGNSATGQVTFVDCSSTLSAIDIPAGTGITYNNLTYITQSSAKSDGIIFPLLKG